MHSRSGFSCSLQEPVLCSCSLYTGSRLTSNQVPVRLVPAVFGSSGFDYIYLFSMLHRLFTFVQLHSTHLIVSTTFSICAQHHSFWLQHPVAVCSLHLNADHGGPSSISCKAFSDSFAPPFSGFVDSGHTRKLS